MLIFSENDKLIQKEIFYEMAELLGIQDGDIDRYKSHGEYEKISNNNNGYPRAIDFEDGGHYAFKQHAKIVNSAIETMLKEILLNSSDSLQV